MSEDTVSTIRESLISAREDLLDLIHDTDPSQWDVTVYAEGEKWRASDLLRHIVSSEKGMTATIKNIQVGGEGVPEDFDLNRWNSRSVAKMRDELPSAMEEELHRNRKNLFELMDSLTTVDLSKKGRHASLRIMTIGEILQMIASHERLHTRDLRSAISSKGQ